MMMAGDTADFTITDASSESGGGGGTGSVRFTNTTETGAHDTTVTLNGVTLSESNGIILFENLPAGTYNVSYTGYDVHNMPATVTVVAGETTEVSFQNMCFVEGTLIRLANGTDKPVEDITYDDELLVWDFDNGCYALAKPAWLKIEETAPSYLLARFSDGSELNTVGPDGMHHEVYDAEEQCFKYTDSMVGHKVITLNGEAECVSCEIVNETVKHYNIITEHHFNCYANGILTSCRLNKMYPIEDMRYVKPEAPRNTPSGLPQDVIDAYRLNEQPENVDEYIERFLAKKV